MKKKPTDSIRHRNQLVISDLDDYALAKAVEDRYLDLSHTYERINHDILLFPDSMSADLLRWREMRVRHDEGDLRHSDAEMQSVRTIAQWTLDVNNEIRNQKKNVLDWKEK